MSIQFAGGTIVNTTFTPTNKATLQSNVITQLTTAGWSQATGPSGGGAQVVTISIASPGVVSLAAHGLLANDSVVFSTTGALPTGLTAGTQYFVKTVLTSGTFTVSASSGGTVINTSGTQSGTQTMVSTVRMQSASTPWSVSFRLKLQDNGGVCITFSIENSNSTLAGGNSTGPTYGGGCQINPGSGSTVYRIIANKYQGFVFQATASPSRGFVGFGTPYLPTFLQGVITECGWMDGNMQNDTDTTIRPSMRTTMSMNGIASNFMGNFQCFANTTLIDMTGQAGNANYAAGGPVLQTATQASYGFASSQAGLLWHDSSAWMFEPLIAWGNALAFINSGPPAFTTQLLIRGQLWDSVMINNIFTGDTTTTFDAHNWWAITDSNNQLVTLFVATS
jgi:hypothetical protein